MPRQKPADRPYETLSVTIPRELMRELRRFTDLYRTTLSQATVEGLRLRLGQATALPELPPRLDVAPELAQLRAMVEDARIQQDLLYRRQERLDGMQLVQDVALEQMHEREERLIQMMQRFSKFLLAHEVRLMGLEGGDVDPEALKEFQRQGRELVEASEADLMVLEAQRVARKEQA